MHLYKSPSVVYNGILEPLTSNQVFEGQLRSQFLLTSHCFKTNTMGHSVGPKSIGYLNNVGDGWGKWKNCVGLKLATTLFFSEPVAVSESRCSLGDAVCCTTFEQQEACSSCELKPQSIAKKIIASRNHTATFLCCFLLQKRHAKAAQRDITGRHSVCEPVLNERSPVKGLGR